MVTVFKSFLRDNLMWLIVYPVICGFSIACFWLFKHFQDELGFTLIHLYGLHPLSIFLISIILAKRNSSGLKTVLVNDFPNIDGCWLHGS